MESNFSNQPFPRFDPHTGQPIQYQKPKEKEAFSIHSMIFAWISLLAGFAFCRAFPFSSHPIGGFLYIIALYLSTYVVLIIKKAKLSLMPLLISGLAICISPALIITSNRFFHFLIALYAIIAWCYLVYGMQGNLLEKGFSDLLLIDFLKAIFSLPFTALGKLFSALFSNRNPKKKGIFGKIILGIIIAILPTIIIFALLSYDSKFVDLFQKLMIISWGDFFSYFFSFLLGIPIAMYLFGAFYAAEKRKCADIITAEKCRSVAASIKLLPLSTALVAVVPILLTYAIFFASQWEYYISAFSGILPDALTCAEYARSGFFQLCAVSVINMIIIYLLSLFVRRKSCVPPMMIRIISAIFSIATLGLIATAFSKLYLYIQRFGLTPLRIYAAWFMVILAALFLLVILKQIFRRMTIVPIGALVCVVLFGLLTLSGADTKIAEYNTNRYIDGTLEKIDVDALKDLGDAAIPSMVRLALHMDQENGTDISILTYEQVYIEPYRNGVPSDYEKLTEVIYDFANQDQSGFFSFSIPKQKARDALSVAKISKLAPQD